jgi:hypothetical protein
MMEEIHSSEIRFLQEPHSLKSQKTAFFKCNGVFSGVQQCRYLGKFQPETCYWTMV